MIKELTITEYHAETEHESASKLKSALRSLREFKYNKDNQEEQQRKPHFDFGNAFECAYLDPENFIKTVAIFDGEAKINEILSSRPDIKAPTMTKEYKDFKGEFEAINSEKYIIPAHGPESYDTILEMIESCNQNEFATKLLKGADKQISIFWEDKESGVKLKTRPDASKNKKNMLADIKTTKDASPRAFNRQINDLNYWLQALMQIDGCLQSGYIEEIEGYFWVAVEKSPPYNCQVYEFMQPDITVKFLEYIKLLMDISEARKLDKWPGYEAEAINDFGVLNAKIW